MTGPSWSARWSTTVQTERACLHVYAWLRTMPAGEYGDVMRCPHEVFFCERCLTYERRPSP